jgi:sulfur carrier protein ThiS
VWVTVQAQGHLKQFRENRQGEFEVDLPDGATVRALIAATGIPWEEVGLVAVNGQQADDQQALSEGDEVLLLAPMEGGSGFY